MELIVAMGILAVTMIPISFSFFGEQKLLRVYYQRAVAMEILDGEMEILAAGGRRMFAGGRQVYRVNAAATTNLPAGDFWLTLDSGRIQLEWKPTVKDHGGSVVREATVK